MTGRTNIKIIVVIIVTIVTTSLIRKQFSHIANQILDFVYLLLTFVREDEPFCASYDNKIESFLLTTKLCSGFSLDG